jgi:hypothetical protein
MVEFIKTILIDISNWKESVLIQRDSSNVFNINDSIIDSCSELQKLTNTAG